MMPETAIADSASGRGKSRSQLQGAALVLGPLLLAAAVVLPVPDGLSPAGWRVAALLAWMILWWTAEAVPAPVTALLPFIVMPVSGVMPVDEAVRNAGSPVLLLLIGGAFMAIAAAKTGLHLRLGRVAVVAGAGGPRRLVLALMGASAFVGMWVATTTATLFMIEIGVGLAAAAAPTASPDQARRFTCAMIIGAAYAAILGGFATFSGNLFNAMAAGMIERQTGEAVNVLDWLRIGLPITTIGVPIAWAVVATVFRFDFRLPARDKLLESLDAPSRWSVPQLAVAATMATALAAWIVMPWLRPIVPGLSDAGVALAGASLMFLLPGERGGRLLSWDDAARVPWGVLLIAAGALAIGAAIGQTGLDKWLARPLGTLAGLPPWTALLGLVAGAVLLTELVNNAAMVALTVPAGTALAAAVGGDPVVFAIAAAIAGLGGYAVPSTPALAIVIGNPAVRAPDLARAGICMLAAMPLVILAAAGANAPG